MGTIRKTIKRPNMPAHLVSIHKMYVAIDVITNDVHIGWTNIDAISNRFTSFDSKLTSLPGAVSCRAVWDSCRDCAKEMIIMK